MLYVLRHGETEWNKAGRLQGHLDSPLTSLGRAQASRQGDILKTLNIAEASVWVSPLGRAVATARIALPDGVKVQSDPRLMEIDLGRWNGWTKKQIMEDAPQVFEDAAPFAWYDHAPGGEGIDALAARVSDFLSEVKGPAVIVTHGITSRVMRCLATRTDVGALAEMGGGQGVVYLVQDGVQTKLV